jgi:predicted RecA/RadA family phage recombinase
MKATTAVKAGMLVGINATGVTDEVDPMDGTSGSMPVGVALYDIAAGKYGAIAGPGCIVYMCNDDDATDIDAGHWVTSNNGTVTGTIVAADPTAMADSATCQSDLLVFGVSIDDLVASSSGGTGRVLIVGPRCTFKTNTK